MKTSHFCYVYLVMISFLYG